MDYVNPPQPPHRGTILLELSALVHLHPRIPEQFIDPVQNSIESFLDLLQFLAHNGFRIVIPEISAVEAGRVLASGNHFEHCYSYERYPEMRGRMVQFLRSVAAHEYPNIEIVKEAPEHIAAVTTGLETVMQSYEHSINSHAQMPLRKGMARKEFLDKLRNRTNTATATATDKLLKQLPEFASSDTLDYLLKTKYAGEKNLFVVSNSYQHLCDLAKMYPSINFSNTNGFIDALVESGLHRHVGLKEGISSVAMNELRIQALIKNMHFEPPKVFSEHDSSGQKLTLQGGQPEDRPLQASFRTLAEEMGKQRQAEHVESKVPEPSRSEKFRKKFGRHYASVSSDGKGEPTR